MPLWPAVRLPIRSLAMGRFEILTICAAALVEYTMDIDLPDSVLENPMVVEMTDAIFDVSIWANVRLLLKCHLVSWLTAMYIQDLCSFNVRTQLSTPWALLTSTSEGTGARRLPEPRSDPHAGIQPRSSISYPQAKGDDTPAAG